MHDRGADATGRVLTPGPGLAALALACFSTQVFAARPFFTDDADVIKPGSCEIEIVQAAQWARAEPSERASSGQLGCGVGASTELTLAGLRLTRGQDDWPALIAGGKTGLLPVADGELGLALAYALTGEKLPGSEFRVTRGAASLVTTQTLGRTLVHGNFGFARDRVEGKNLPVWGMAVERIGTRFDYGGELYGESTRSAWLGAGARYAVLPDRFSIDASYAMRGNSARVRRATVGVTLAF
jgi:hypothetical protein